MATVTEIYHMLDEAAPFETQMSFDNAGFLVGHGERAVDRLLVALDITLDVIREAEEWGAQLIVSHHPVIFFPVKRVTDGDPVGRKLLALSEGGIAAICAHTNLDAALGGVNDCLARAVGLHGIGQLHQDGVDRLGRPYGIGRVGTLERETAPALPDFAREVKEALGANGVRFVDAGRPVRKVAVGGGACADMVGDALALGCDTFVTSDVKYDGFLDARALGINLIDAGHFPTENVVVAPLAELLRSQLPGAEVRVSARHHEVFSYL